jgi:hypothetical protein
VIVIVLIGVPVGADDEVDPLLEVLELLPPLAALLVLLLELLPHADSASAATSPAATRTSDHCRRHGGAPLLSRPGICTLLRRYDAAANRARRDTKCGKAKDGSVSPLRTRRELLENPRRAIDAEPAVLASARNADCAND